MTDFDASLFLCLCAVSCIGLVLPDRYRLDGVMLFTLVLFSLYAPITLAWMTATVLLTYSASRLPVAFKPLGTWSMVLLIAAMFAIYKTIDRSGEAFGFEPPVLMGLAYFFCRQIHLLVESLKNPAMRLTLRQHLNYNFFLPVMLAGPIHRYQHFFRQCERRRTDSANLTGGLERILYGYAKVIIGNVLISYKLTMFIGILQLSGFPSLLAESAVDWLNLYIQFSGYTDIALGFSLFLGLRLEENFNNPLAATTLIEFWQRWHMTLSSWCRDYVFSPLQAATRNQLFAVMAAMVAMGLWHEFSIYYILWGIYHAAGISLCRVYQLTNDPLRLGSLPRPLRNTVTRTATLAWLVSGMPVISTILALINKGNV